MEGGSGRTFPSRHPFCEPLKMKLIYYQQQQRVDSMVPTSYKTSDILYINKLLSQVSQLTAWRAVLPLKQIL